MSLPSELAFLKQNLDDAVQNPSVFHSTIEKHVIRITTILLFCFAAGSSSTGQEYANSLRPLMNIPATRVFASDFSIPGKLDKSAWQARQGTQWKVVDGVLRGEQSSAEYQAKKADHKGYDPRIKSLKTPRQFIAKFSVRFIGGQETNLLPIFEFGHHNVRLKFGKSGLVMLADHETVQLFETDEVKLESGRWYHVMAERNADEFVVQFEGGPTLYAKHTSVAMPVADDADGLGIAGTRKGVVEIDNVQLWNVEENISPKWASIRERLPRSVAKPVAKKRKKKK